MDDTLAAVELIQGRLRAIVQALEGRDVRTNGEELWFECGTSTVVQVRLRADSEGRFYDRSTNFSVSYGDGVSPDLVASIFPGIVRRIKAIDDTAVSAAALAFRTASEAVVAQLAATHAVGDEGERDEIERHTGRPNDPVAIPASQAEVGWTATAQEQPCGGALRDVVVVGGGTAGYFAALALKTEFPELKVTVIESSKIPIIGVGEATTTLMPVFLHEQLGIDIVELYREVCPTWKLGIRFEWGLPGEYYFNYPFGESSPAEAYAHEGHIGNLSAAALLMASNRTPIVIEEDGEIISLLPHANFAYHLDNKKFVAYLAEFARRAGIHHVDAEIKDAPTRDGESVDRLILDDGREIRADLYVDASGFRALLIEKKLGSRFIDFTSSLFCDTAVVGELPQRGFIQPYTTAETMDAGWCWRIPVEGEDHRGYVYSSAFITSDQARAEMEAKNPGLGDTWTVRFRSGRHQELWKGNTVAIGNAYGFVEPLESTALHMVIIEISYVVEALRTARDSQVDRAFVNSRIGAHWDSLRWFLSVHYKYNRKRDSNFWRQCRETVDVSGIEPLLDRFHRLGPRSAPDDSTDVIIDPTFNYDALMILLLGQHAPCPVPTTTVLSRTQWDARVAEGRSLVARALDQARALDLLRRRPDLLSELVAPNGPSWIASASRTSGGEWRELQELVNANRRDRGFDEGERREVSGRGQNKESRPPYQHLFQSIVPQRDRR